jgi:hypothetical protein
LNTSDFFNELGLGDPDMDKAREWVSYRKFANSVPDILTLDEYIDTIYKKVITDNAKPHMWFSQRYMVAKYLLQSGSKNNATDEYVTLVNERIKKLKDSIPAGSQFEHIHSFLDVLTEQISINRNILPKEVLVYLNELYKTKGIK